MKTAEGLTFRWPEQHGVERWSRVTFLHRSFDSFKHFSKNQLHFLIKTGIGHFCGLLFCSFWCQVGVYICGYIGMFSLRYLCIVEFGVYLYIFIRFLLQKTFTLKEKQSEDHKSIIYGILLEGLYGSALMLFRFAFIFNLRSSDNGPPFKNFLDSNVILNQICKNKCQIWCYEGTFYVRSNKSKSRLKQLSFDVSKVSWRFWRNGWSLEDDSDAKDFVLTQKKQCWWFKKTKIFSSFVIFHTRSTCQVSLRSIWPQIGQTLERYVLRLLIWHFFLLGNFNFITCFELKTK